MSTFTHIIRAMTFTPGLNGRWGIPMLFESEPGMAKTSILNTLRDDGLAVVTILGSVRDPSDIGGLPVEVNGVIHRCPDTWVAEVTKAKRAVVFFDELNTSMPAVMNAMLRVINEGVVGDDTLPPTVRFVAAQNPVEQTAGGYDLAPPMANRFCHVAWQAPTHADWSSWMLGSDDAAFGADAGNPNADVDGETAEALEAKVLKAWPRAWSRARGTIAAFIGARPELLHKMPKVDDPNASKAWPSRRTWEMAARVLAGADVHKLSEADTNLLVAGCVGVAASAEFSAWRAAQDLPDAAAVLDGEVSFGHDPRRLDRTAAVLNACAALVTDRGCDKREARITMLWTMLGALVDHAADLTVPAARVLIKAGLGGNAAARPTLAKLEPLLRAAGIR